jgi:DNA primase catalytic core
MAQISQEIINKIKDNADIVTIIGRELNLRKNGRNFIGVCPFHADKSPSLTVSPQKNIYTCFACGATGDVINFVKEYEKVSFIEAVKILAKGSHIEIPDAKMTPEEIAREKRRESALIVLQESQDMFRKNLDDFEPASNYIRKVRQISDDMISLYGIGYAQADNQINRNFPKRGYSIDSLMAAGMISISDEKKFHYDVFRQRITFPYYDLHGRPVGFTGRITDNNIKTAKYLNSSDTVVFNKGAVIFGLYQAREAIIQSGRTYLTEGQTDVISVAQRGVRNVIAGSGTALTDTQARLIKRFTNTVVLMYDPDAAGLKASIANAKTLLAHGFDVRAVMLPEGQDPDDFCKSTASEDLGILLKNREKGFIEYFYAAKNVAGASDFENTQLLDLVCECIAAVPDKYLREKYMIRLSSVFNTSMQMIVDRVKPLKDLKIENWKVGFYGIDEASELIEDRELSECCLVFKEEDFMKSFSEEPTVLAVGMPSLADIQSLRQVTNKISVVFSEVLKPKELIEPPELQLLKIMHRNGMEISVEFASGEVINFCDCYVDTYSSMLGKTRNDDGDEIITDSTKRAEVIGRCAEVISQLEATTRAVMNDVYAKKLGMKLSAFEKVLKPFLAKKKDKAMIDNQRLNELTDAFAIDPEIVPEYVEKNPVLWSTYLKWGFYPLSDKNGRYFSYMFKNQNGSSHSSVSDFFMKPLLHIYDESNDNSNNKRVVQLCHMDKRLDKYVEWKSGIFSILPKVHEQLVNAGPYNFFGSVDQYKRIWMNMSYGFTKCYPTTVLGQHPEGFFVFGNAIFHKVDGKYQIDYVDDLGVVSHEDTNYYLPAFSKIHLDRKNDNDKNRYKLARNFMYKEIPESKQISFDKWADLMNRVYSVNNNGKWAILYAITCGFRDFIFENRGEFTAPFFIGPTSSGKSKIAESIRNLYMDYKSAAFNLNTGTPAAFFMFVESLRNLPIVMEEYNDNDINPMIFQALKAATLDGQGRIKVADAASKTMDSSDINASLILLGQEAPQKDDGSLANRCIICDVPSRDFTEEERETFEELKEYEKNGLANILLQVLELRETFEKHYLGILVEETKKLKDSVKMNISNTEGLMRIVNACALMTSTCRIIEEHAPHLKLPFTYEEFRPIADQKVFSQVERISSTNKLSTYFQTISTLVTHERIKLGRELKISETSRVTRLLSGKKKEEVELPLATKVLYIDFESVYSLYHKEVGSNEALSRQSLTAYFNSNQAFIGQCNATRFRWQVPEHVGADLQGELTADGNSINPVINARMRMVDKTKTTSAYMFNYNILKSLVDIDFERKDEENNNDGIISPDPEQGIPF